MSAARPVRVAGAVLCGGDSRRMGVDKASLLFDDVPLAEHVARAIEEAGCAPVWFVGGGSEVLAATGRRIVADEHPGRGPVGGVLTALHALGVDPGGSWDGVVVAACDLVGLTPEAARRVVPTDADEAASITMAYSDRLEPLLAFWPLAREPEIVAAFATSRSMHALADRLGVRTAAVRAEWMRNANTLDDLPPEMAASAAIRVRPVASVSHVPRPEIEIAELAPLVASGARVIDVREPDEYAAGHVPGAELIPLGTVPDHLDRFAAEGSVYVICRSGARSMRAAELAAEAGHDTVNVAGGTLAWIEAGHEVVTGDRPS